MKPSRTHDIARRTLTILAVVTAACLLLTGYALVTGSESVGALATMTGIAIGALGAGGVGGSAAMGIRTGWLGVRGSSDATPYDDETRAT